MSPQREDGPGVTGSEAPAFPAVTALLAVIVVAFAAVVVAMPVKFFAEDSYFYFQVAWNFARGLGSTFNGIVPTNGYHPLWMLCCAAVFRVLPSRAHALYGIAAMLCVFDLGALALVRTLLRRLGVSAWPLAVLVYAPFCFLSQLGTEGALSGFLLVLLMLTMWSAAAKPSTRNLAVANTVAGLAILTRLDSIFVVALVWMAVWLALGTQHNMRQHPYKASRLRFMLCGAIPAAMCGFYLYTNHHYFGTFQPISGLLKSTSDLDHRFGQNLPHTGQFALLVIVLCLPLLALRRRDLFFKTVELPFALGVFVHAYYILFRMSTETRWSWYYTSWMLLSAVLLARVASLALERRSRLASQAGWAAVVLLTLVWVKSDLYGYIPQPLDQHYLTFQHDVYEIHGVRRLVAYDGPGRSAYFSDVQIVPLDGLMGDLNFQHELGSKGINAFIRAHNIDAFAGPPVPFDKGAEGALCEHINLGSTMPHCMKTGPGEWSVSSEEVFARYPARDAGAIPLSPENIIWSSPGYLSVWKLAPPQK